MYEDKTPQAIKAEILGALTTDLDKREGSFADDMAGPVALELYKAYGSLNAVEPIIWVNETSGPYLDLAAEDMGIEPRKQGVRAQVTLFITGEQDYLLPAGTAFLTPEGLRFETAQETLLQEDGVLAEARAAQPGSAYNAKPDTVTLQYVNNPRIRSVTNPQAGAGGTDPETDASLYARIALARQRPSTSGNIHDYHRWALEVSGVGAVKVFPLKDGPGTVTVLVAGPDRQPVDDQVAAACAAHLEEVRPIGAAVTVLSARPLPVDVTAVARLEAGYSQEQVAQEFEKALSGYLEEVAFQKLQVLYSKIGALLMGVAGVLDYSGLTLCGAQDNLDLEEDQIPVAGEVALSWI